MTQVQLHLLCLGHTIDAPCLVRAPNFSAPGPRSPGDEGEASQGCRQVGSPRQSCWPPATGRGLWRRGAHEQRPIPILYPAAGSAQPLGGGGTDHSYRSPHIWKPQDPALKGRRAYRENPGQGWVREAPARQTHKRGSGGLLAVTRACVHAPHSQCSPVVQRWPWLAGCPPRDLHSGRDCCGAAEVKAGGSPWGPALPSWVQHSSV